MPSYTRQPRGERHGRHVLTTQQVRDIRTRYTAGGVTQMDLALDYEVSQGLIWQIVTRRVWRHVPTPAAPAT